MTMLDQIDELQSEQYGINKLDKFMAASPQ